MKYVLFSICLVFMTTACNKKNSQKKLGLQNFDGKWTMVGYMAFMPDLPTLAPGDIIWKFDVKAKKVEVKMKDSKRTENIGFNPGSYTYEVKDNKIIINGRDYFYKIDEGGTVLKLDKNTDPQLSKDRPVMNFIRLKMN